MNLRRRLDSDSGHHVKSEKGRDLEEEDRAGNDALTTVTMELIKKKLFEYSNRRRLIDLSKTFSWKIRLEFVISPNVSVWQIP